MPFDAKTLDLDALPTCPMAPLRGDGVILGAVRRARGRVGVPAGFDAPADPLLAVLFARIGDVTAGGVLARVARDDEEGWLPLAVRTADPRLPDAARAVGVEAGLAELGLAPSEDGWEAWSARRGRPSEVLERLSWKPGLRGHDPDLTDAAERLVTLADPLLLPSGRVELSLVSPGGLQPHAGTARGDAEGPGALLEGRLQLTLRVEARAAAATAVVVHARACHVRRQLAAGRRAARRRR